MAQRLRRETRPRSLRRAGDGAYHALSASHAGTRAIFEFYNGLLLLAFKEKIGDNYIFEFVFFIRFRIALK